MVIISVVPIRKKALSALQNTRLGSGLVYTQILSIHHYTVVLANKSNTHTHTHISIFISAGNHGWDPRYSPHMHPLFLAVGPAFKQGLRDARPFHIVDIYSLMCHILGLEPAPNNGSLSKTAHILSSPPVEIDIIQLESLSQPSCYAGGMYVGCRREVCSILETRPMFLLLL